MVANESKSNISDIEVDVIDAILGAMFGVWAGEFLPKLVFDIWHLLLFTVALLVLVLGIANWIRSRKLWQWFGAIVIFSNMCLFWTNYSRNHGVEITPFMEYFGIVILLVWTVAFELRIRGWY